MSASPGPWRAVKRGSTYDIVDANGMIRAIDVGPPAEDAALVAAAPALLALLRDFEQATWCPACSSHGYHTSTCALAILLEPFADADHPMNERQKPKT